MAGFFIVTKQKKMKAGDSCLRVDGSSVFRTISFNLFSQSLSFCRELKQIYYWGEKNKMT